MPALAITASPELSGFKSNETDSKPQEEDRIKDSSLVSSQIPSIDTAQDSTPDGKSINRREPSTVATDNKLGKGIAQEPESITEQILSWWDKFTRGYAGNNQENNPARVRRNAEPERQESTSENHETDNVTPTASTATAPENADADELQALHLKLQNELSINMESARDWHFLIILLTYSNLCPEDSAKLDPIIEKANTNIARQTMALFYSQLVEYRDVIKSFDPETGIAYSKIIDSVEEKTTTILNEPDSEESSTGKALFDLISEAMLD